MMHLNIFCNFSISHKFSSISFNIDLCQLCKDFSCASCFEQSNSNNKCSNRIYISNKILLSICVLYEKDKKENLKYFFLIKS